MKRLLLITLSLAALSLNAQTNCPVLHLDSYEPNALFLIGPGVHEAFAAVTITVSNATVGDEDVIYFSGNDTNLLGPTTNWQTFYSGPAVSNVYSVTVYPPMTNAVGYFRLVETR